MFPQWDLLIVLAGLKSPPFELKDMRQIEKFFTYQTLFLLMLVSGARRGEMHVLDFTKMGWSKIGLVVSLKHNPFFRAKTHAPDKPMIAFQGFSVRSLSATLEHDDPDWALCPVRAFKWYVKRMEPIRKGRKPLFLPLNEKATEIGRAHV